MRGDIKDKIEFLGKENLDLCNKTELARRFDCDPRTIDRYIKISKGEILPKTSRRVYTSKLDDYKEIIIDKVDKFGCTAMSVYKFIQGKGYSGKYSIVADFVRQSIRLLKQRKQLFVMRQIQVFRHRLTGKKT